MYNSRNILLCSTWTFGGFRIRRHRKIPQYYCIETHFSAHGLLVLLPEVRFASTYLVVFLSFLLPLLFIARVLHYPTRSFLIAGHVFIVFNYRVAALVATVLSISYVVLILCWINAICHFVMTLLDFCTPFVLCAGISPWISQFLLFWKAFPDYPVISILGLSRELNGRVCF